MRYFIISLFITGAFAVLPNPAAGAEFFVTTDRSTIKVGDEFMVQAILSTDEYANALEGEIVVPASQFSIKKIYTGSSVVSFWVTHPKERSSGVVSFSGITPGGFSGVNKMVLELLLVAERPGTTTISLANMRLLAHDGYGSDLGFTRRSIVLSVAPSQDGTEASSILIDTDAPQPFTPIITSSPDVFAGKKVLIFTTQDKQTGIDAYYIREYSSRFDRIFSPWKKVESPYVLKDQSEQSFIDIKAVDNAGNERLVSIVPARAEGATRGLVLVLVLAVLITAILVGYRTRQRLLRIVRHKVHTLEK